MANLGGKCNCLFCGKDRPQGDFVAHPVDPTLSFCNRCVNLRAVRLDANRKRTVKALLCDLCCCSQSRPVKQCSSCPTALCSQCMSITWGQGGLNRSNAPNWQCVPCLEKKVAAATLTNQQLATAVLGPLQNMATMGTSIATSANAVSQQLQASVQNNQPGVGLVYRTHVADTTIRVREDDIRNFRNPRLKKQDSVYVFLRALKQGGWLKPRNTSRFWFNNIYDMFSIICTECRADFGTEDHFKKNWRALLTQGMTDIPDYPKQ